jgi:N-acetylglucosamine kinase
MSSPRIPRKHVYKKPEFIVAISGGHSASVAVALDPVRGIIGAASHTGINPHLVPYEKLADEFIRLLNNLAAACNMTREDLYANATRIAMSCPGAASKFDKALLELALKRIFGETKRREFTIVDDTLAGLIAGALALRGTCAFAGTGASVFVGLGKQPTGWAGKIDGWGYIIGDFGSGFQIVVEMFRQFCRFWNQHGKTPPLFHHIDELIYSNSLRLPRINEIENTQKWLDTITLIDFHRDWRVEFAKLAAAITMAADRKSPDPMATRLVDLAAFDMVRSIEIAMARFPETKKWPLVLQGGMFEHSRLYRNIVVKAIAPKLQAPIALARYRPVLGVALLTLQKLGLRIDTQGVEFIEQCVNSAKDPTLLVRSAPAGFAHKEFLDLGKTGSLRPIKPVNGPRIK